MTQDMVLQTGSAVVECGFKVKLKWAKSKTDISKEEEDIVRKTKKSCLFYDKTAYRKKGQPC